MNFEFSNTIPHVSQGWQTLLEEWNSPLHGTQHTRWEKLSLNAIKRPIVAIAIAIYAIATPLLAAVDFIYTAINKQMQVTHKTTVERNTSMPSFPPVELDRQGWGKLMERKEDVIAGYLEIGKADGWQEGGNTAIGALFTRVIFRKLMMENEGKLQKNWDILHRVNAALYRDVRGKAQAYYDHEATGWNTHAVSRIIGYLGSTPREPFFELLINSARSSQHSDQTFPFAIHIMPNQDNANARFEILKKMKNKPAAIANSIYYASQLITPNQYLNGNKKRLDAQTVRFLNGLNYLSTVKYDAQKVGNCWMRQPMLCVLASAYIELLTHRPNLSHQACWEEAKSIYQDFNAFTVKEIKTILFSGGISLDLSALAQRKLVAINAF